MIKYPLSTLLYIAKINIKDTIQHTLKLHDNVDAYITIEVKDKNGNILKRHKQHSHSFVNNFLTGLYIFWANAPTICAGYLGYSTGLQIGTGTTPPSPNDTALTDPIANGTGAGQMTYPSSPNFTEPVVNGNTSTMTIQSTITNNSGASIIVSEVGLNGKSPGCNFNALTGLLTHDLLSSPITVPNGTAITITYTISVTT